MNRLAVSIIVLATLAFSVKAQTNAQPSPLTSHLSPLTSQLSTQNKLSTLNSQLSTQEKLSTPFRDYQFVKRSDPWSNSQNPAALTRFSSPNIAEAELSLTKERGGFTDYFESPDALQADARVESFYRLSRRTVCFGSMSYNSFDGKDMAGSAFIDPRRRPFDLVEDSLGNEGDKHRDTYRLCGGFGSTIYHGIAVGMQLDYTSANYAKYKDLRHQNKFMNMQVSAGVYVPFAAWGALGLNYLYQRNTESLTFGTYGKNDKVYQTLVGYAAFMGHLEQFGSTGYTDKSREMPLVSEQNGLGLQLSLQLDAQTALYGSLALARSEGYYGRKSPYTITYDTFDSDLYRYAARLTHQSGETRYCLDLSLDIENLQNDASTYRELLNESGATYYEYYAPVKTANKLWTNFGLSCTVDLGLRNELPAWTLMAGMNRMERRQTGYVYPYCRRQTLSSYELLMALSHRLLLKNGVWTFSLNGSFSQGEGEPSENFTFCEPSDKQTEPPVMVAYLYREYQYLTSAQYRVGGEVKYAFLFPRTALQTHVCLGLQHRKANETNAYSKGCDRTTVRLTFGCTF